MVTMSVSFSRPEYDRLRKIAIGGGTTVPDIIKGFVSMYLGGQRPQSRAPAVAPAPSEDTVFARAVLALARDYQQRGGRPPHQKRPGPVHRCLTPAQDAQALQMSLRGLTRSEIGERLGVNRMTALRAIRRAQSRASR